MQEHGKHTFTMEFLLEMVLCNLLLGSFNSWTTTVETVCSMWTVPKSYLEDNWGNPVNSQLIES
jgi:hypothetical protein